MPIIENCRKSKFREGNITLFWTCYIWDVHSGDTKLAVGYKNQEFSREVVPEINMRVVIW